MAENKAIYLIYVNDFPSKEKKLNLVSSGIIPLKFMKVSVSNSKWRFNLNNKQNKCA